MKFYLILTMHLCILSGNYGQDGYIESDFLAVLVSPNYPDTYPNNILKEWNEVIPNNTQGLLLIDALNIERAWDSLTVSYVSAHDNDHTLFSLARSNVTSLIFTPGQIKVTFCTDGVAGKAGFALNLRAILSNESDLVNDDDFLCGNEFEVIHRIARCDGIPDCQDFSDETDCDHDDNIHGCNNGWFSCQGTDICLLPSLICDGVEDCPLADDEAQCASVFCPIDCQCGQSAYNDRHGPPSPVCNGQLDWLPFWVNCSNAWTRDHARNASKTTTILNLKNSQITSLEARSFQELGYTWILDLTDNRLQYLPVGVFDGLQRLSKLVLDSNQILSLEAGTFRGLRGLNLLYLDFNNLTSPGLKDGCFTDLDSLWFISVSFQGLTDLRPGTFKDLTSLKRLILVYNQITSINSSLLTGASEHLKLLNLKSNPLTFISPETFSNATLLKDLRIESLATSMIPLSSDTFHGLHNLEMMYMNDPRLCCIMPSVVKCTYGKPYHPLFTCRKTFLQNNTIQVFMWIVGMSALIGNAIVIVHRLAAKFSSEVAAVQSILIMNLAGADFLMGIYMVLMAVMNMYIGESYFWNGRAEEWRSSTPCQIAGFISMVSSEASVFIVTIVSVDRFITILAPFSDWRLRVRTTRLVMMVTWLVAFLLGAVSLILNYLSPDAYSLSDVCVGLPLIRKDTAIQKSLDTNTVSQYGVDGFFTVANSSVSTWQFSIVLFLGVNLFSFVVIAICYIAIFIKVRYSRAKVGRNALPGAEVKMAVKMSLIVGTDFCCWMPIIILGILVQGAGVTITPDVYAWLVAFVIPINSCLNPYLYTIIGNM